MISLEEVRRLDAAYKAIPDFESWTIEIDTQQVDRLAEVLRAKREESAKVVEGAVQFALRAAAFDTGALEALYETDRGLTFSVAAEAAHWQQQVDERSDDARRFFEAQLQAHELLVDAVTGTLPISEAWIRRLHEELCAAQNTYSVLTAQGRQDQPLPKGIYKTQPNHVLQQDGKYFPFAPVEQTPHEMNRFVEQLRSDAFDSAHPVVQAAYAHYQFVRIHPFADGNGRAARALASLFLLRAFSVPLVIFAKEKGTYLDVLVAADRGDTAQLAAYVHDQTVDILELVIERADRHVGRPVDKTIRELSQMFRPGGFDHRELDRGAETLTESIDKSLASLLETVQTDSVVHVRLEAVPVSHGQIPSNYRISNGPKIGPRLVISTDFPDAPASVTFFLVLISKPTAEEDMHFLVRGRTAIERAPRGFTSTLDLPSLSIRAGQWSERAAITEIRLRDWTESILSQLLAEFREVSELDLRSRGLIH